MSMSSGLIIIITLAKLALRVDAEITVDNSTSGNTSVSLEDYVESYRRQFTTYIEDHNNRVDALHKLYEKNLESVEIQKQFLLDRIRQAEEHLFPLELLNSQSKKCVSKYRNEMPNSGRAQSDISECLEAARYQLKEIGADPRRTVKILENYYSKIFEESATNCLAEVNTPFKCVEEEILSANEFTINNNLKFDEEMDNSEHQARTHIKAVFNCSFVIHFQTAMAIAEAKVNIELCMKSEDNYCACQDGHTCENLQHVRPSELNSENITISNSLYGKSKSCLLLAASPEEENKPKEEAAAKAKPESPKKDNRKEAAAAPTKGAKKKKKRT
uniref:Protein TsetseEP domain-containing protein n=1 Tax=Glossina brevipalpis TaxID=37001 RepID=A0A1A9X171_9MUSC